MKPKGENRPPGKTTASMDALLSAILEDDCSRAKELIKAGPALSTLLIEEPRLYQLKIFHWIYAGETALHLAAAGYRAELVRLLLAAGADPNSIQNHRQSGPLHYAADGCLDTPAWDPARQVQTIQTLLDAGAKINARDKNGASPLHRAVRTRSAAAVNYFLQRGADPLLKNKPGSTPFHLAVQNTGRGGSGSEAAKAAQREIINAFLSIGLKPSLEDNNGKSVLESARVGWIRNILSQNASEAS